MRGNITKKIVGSIGALALMLSMAAPAFADTLTVDIGSGQTFTPTNSNAGDGLTLITGLDATDNDGGVHGCFISSDNGASVATNGECTTNIHVTDTAVRFVGPTPAGTYKLCINVGNTTGGPTPGDAVCSTTTFSIATPGGGGFTISSMFTSSDFETTATTVATQVTPYVLAIFGILLIVGIAMALLKKGQRGIIGTFSGKEKKTSRRER